MAETDLSDERNLTEEQKLFKESISDWGERNLPLERVIEMNREGHPFPEDIVEGLADLGVIMGTVPEEHGGMGLDWTDQAVIAEQIGYIDPSIATAAGFMAVETGWGFTINRHCNEEVREKFVKPAINGNKFIGIATTEPGGGSDVAGFESTAEKDGDEWILNGEKTFISGVEECKKMGGGYWVNVRTGPQVEGAPYKNMTSFFVPIDSDGLEPQEPYDDAGRGSLSTSGFKMNDVRVPDEYMLGEEGKGFYYTMEGFDNARVMIGASAVGVTRRILEEAADYIKERETFGNPLAKYEGIQFPFVERYTEMEASDLMVKRTTEMQNTRYDEAGWKEKKEKPQTYKPTEIAKWISMIKYKIPHLAKDTADDAMHWLGAAGYSSEYIFETAWRGVMSYCVGAEGGANIQKIVIGRETLGKDYVPYK
ncbi:MAG: acyl-CoA/acyl-ACP dehydrogenase [Candidatus Thermoplasmatota archaeon]|nr:acyl-CoA/acyl-ACP dehydrogenase [Candidatus Thermoplasmatota archaeon]